MIEENFNPDLAKEFLTVLAYCDNSFLSKIPGKFLKKLNDLAADSLKDFYIDKNKTLIEQDLSDECQDLIALVYFMYMTDSNIKKQILSELLKK